MENPANNTSTPVPSDPIAGTQPDFSPPSPPKDFSLSETPPLSPPGTSVPPEAQSEPSDNSQKVSTPAPNLVFQKENAGNPETRKTRKPFLIGGAILVLLLVSTAVAVYFIQKGGFGLQKKATVETCTYGQACSVNGRSGTQSCTGTLQNGVCKYDPAVAPNCSACTYCGDGVCGGGEGPDNCPADCGAGGGGGGCTVQKTYSGASTPGMDCKQGSSASVTLKACVPAGCPATSITYHSVNKTCTGSEWAGCSGACGDSGGNATLSIPAGGCAEATVSCSAPDCGSCQVDIDNYGVRRWQ
ncbi:MAG: hypothetical protein ACPLY7_02360, partial [Microgenomates group bacterium]